SSPALQSPIRYVEEKRLLLDFMCRRWAEAMEHMVFSAKSDLTKQAAQLHALSPLGVLGRGYAIAKKSSGDVITSSRQLQAGEHLHLSFAEGEALCQVLQVKGQTDDQREADVGNDKEEKR
ncbi:MAG: hypothetical protein IIY71_04335, partial [Oscillospiraceae bacterium]|nr:hypothetical protein [Oscillospiraceae bacterium]